MALLLNFGFFCHCRYGKFVLGKDQQDTENEFSDISWVVMMVCTPIDHYFFLCILCCSGQMRPYGRENDHVMGARATFKTSLSQHPPKPRHASFEYRCTLVPARTHARHAFSAPFICAPGAGNQIEENCDRYIHLPALIQSEHASR